MEKKIFTAVIPAVIAVSQLLYFIFRRISIPKKKLKSDKLLDIINNHKKLQLRKDDIKIYKKEYKRIVFFEFSGLYISSKRRKEVVAFQKKYKEKINWNQIKIASKYFEFSKEKMKVAVPFVEKLLFVLFAICTLLLISYTIYIFLNPIEIEEKKEFLIKMIFLSVSFLSFLLTIHIMIPLNAVRLIKNA